MDVRVGPAISVRIDLMDVGVSMAASIRVGPAVDVLASFSGNTQFVLICNVRSTSAAR
jgi:hypothetical protein